MDDDYDWKVANLAFSSLELLSKISVLSSSEHKLDICIQSVIKLVIGDMYSTDKKLEWIMQMDGRAFWKAAVSFIFTVQICTPIFAKSSKLDM